MIKIIIVIKSNCRKINYTTILVIIITIITKNNNFIYYCITYNKLNNNSIFIKLKN